jgi:hypothetical protein
MKEEYLWDKSGAPDPEIQKLEQIMGTLRYQPRPLDLGDDVQVRRGIRKLPLLAIAATLLIALFAGGLWLHVRNKTVPQLHKATNESAAPQKLNSPENDNRRSEQANALPNGPTHERKPIVRSFKHSTTLRDSNMTASERAQALEAKQQLMIALRLTSEKLSLAQRKAQGASPNQIRNQHKVG